MNYCVAGTDLRGFVKAFVSGEQKGYFSYEWFTSFEKLDLRSDLKVEHFNLLLKNTVMSEDAVNLVIKICNSLALISQRFTEVVQ